MDQQSSQELLIESKGVGFSRVQKPDVAAMQLQLLPYVSIPYLHRLLANLIKITICPRK